MLLKLLLTLLTVNVTEARRSRRESAQNTRRHFLVFVCKENKKVSFVKAYAKFLFRVSRTPANVEDGSQPSNHSILFLKKQGPTNIGATRTKRRRANKSVSQSAATYEKKRTNRFMYVYFCMDSLLILRRSTCFSRGISFLSILFFHLYYNYHYYY